MLQYNYYTLFLSFEKIWSLIMLKDERKSNITSTTNGAHNLVLSVQRCDMYYYIGGDFLYDTWTTFSLLQKLKAFFSFWKNMVCFILCFYVFSWRCNCKWKNFCLRTQEWMQLICIYICVSKSNFALSKTPRGIFFACVDPCVIQWGIYWGEIFRWDCLYINKEKPTPCTTLQARRCWVLSYFS